MNRRGVTLIEVLLSIVIVAIASIATLTYFSHAKGGIGKTGNRRAALERARQRLEEMMASNGSDMKPPSSDGGLHWVSCTTGSPCKLVPSNTDPNEKVEVEDLGPLPVEALAQWVDDPAAGTGPPPHPPNPIIYDTLVFDVKVWFVPNSTADDDFNRVHIRTLRTP